MEEFKVVDYYDNCEGDYSLFWDLGKSLAMHYGFWDKNTKNLHQALINENLAVAKTANIKKTDKVLDAGCGVGGTSIFLAKTVGCDVTGITLSRKQVESATRNAKIHGANNVKFKERDYTNTKFADNSFDVVFGIESVWHAKNKKDFIDESKRILKKGGRLVVADFFLSKKALAETKNQELKKWFNDWATDSIESVTNFSRLLKESGFRNIKFEDTTQMVVPSSKRLYYYSLPGIFIWKIAGNLGIISKLRIKNAEGCYYQYKALKKSLWTYGIFYAEK